MINFDVPLKNYQNANIKAVILSDEEMHEIGFTDYNKPYWYYCKTIARGLTFNVTIAKKSGRIKIEVLEEACLQPYDYQNLIKLGSRNEYVLKVHNIVQEQMAHLIKKGIITGYNMGDYI